MTRTVPTTTLIITKPTNLELLEKEYKLVRYVLPDNFRYKAKNNKTYYGQMHNALRDQLDYPYKAFKYDHLEKTSYKWVIYVIYPVSAPIKQVTIPFLDDRPLAVSEVPFATLDLHLLLKLLHIAYFRGSNSELAGRFIGQDRCYVYAKYDKKKKTYVCLEIELRGDIDNQQKQDVQEFKVIGHARPFRRTDSMSMSSYAYFGTRDRGPKRYFIHLKRSEFETANQTSDPIYTIRTQENQRTTLAYHDQQHIESCVGKILYDFIRDFRAYLKYYGISCQSKERTFTELVPSKGQTHLSLEQLQTVPVYDNRLNQRNHSLQDYLELFEQMVPEVHFIQIKNIDLASADKQAVLLVQDHNREDFEEKAILEDHIDPYEIIYQRFPYIPKQSISINPNEPENLIEEEYLQYSLPTTDDNNFKQKFKVTLFQLYLKDVILHQKSVKEFLPLAPINYVFIRKSRYYSTSYETLLYIDNDKLQFLDLRGPEALRQRDELLKRLGVDWKEMYNKMLSKYHKNQENEEKEIMSYDIIIGPNFFVELENLNERVLYNYDEILERQTAVKTELPIHDLKLTQHYDCVRGKNDLPYEELYKRGLLDQQKTPKTASEKKALDLYQKLVKYDSFLDEIAQARVVISFENLTEGELWERIIEIFDYKPDVKGRLTCASFKALYQSRKWFLSDKEKTLHLYDGIWYDQDNSYMVGSAQQMKMNQPRAHLIRHFDVYMGKDHFDKYPLLLAMGVQFVRHKQYTVYPYPFHLIDLYVENILRFQ